MKSEANYSDSFFADTWAKEYGELLNKTQIAKMLGVDRRTVLRRVQEGKYKANSDGSRVFTRSVAVYEQTGIPQGTPSIPIPIEAIQRPTCRFRIERSK